MAETPTPTDIKNFSSGRSLPLPNEGLIMKIKSAGLTVAAAVATAFAPLGALAILLALTPVVPAAHTGPYLSVGIRRRRRLH
jgi:hypothetical protein